MSHGQKLAEQGQSVRAEQYYLAAVQQGADPGAALTQIIETCVQSGRLGSALAHAERRLRDEPQSAALLRLTASLNDALGHAQRAREQVERLTRTSPMDDEASLFIAEFFDRSGDATRAEFYYRAYLGATVPAQRKPWVEPALERLLARRLSAPERLSEVLW